jgi:hypothetical protein
MLKAIVALDSDLSIFNTNSIQIHVKFSDKIIPKIAGNSYMSINSKESFFLDASQSYDIDFPGNSNLDFMWTCQEIKPIFGKNCPEEIVLQNTPTNFIPSDLFSLGMKTFVFIVAISTKSGFVSSSREVFVTVIGDTIVSSYIDLDANQKGDLLPLLLDKVSRNNIFTIESKISASTETSGRLTWLSNDFDPDALQESALTHLSVTVPPGSLGGVIFALPANTLMPGALYTFTLQIKSQKKFQNEASPDSVISVQVIVNSPPSIDSFTVLPPFGYTLQTHFNFLASNYWDEPQDYPLSFRFVCYHISPHQFMLMQDKSFNPSYSSLLPIGLRIANSQLTCSVNIYDIYSDYSTLTQKVQIFPIDSNALTTALNTSLSTAESVNDITSQELILIAGLTLAYSYDCSVTSSVLCGRRNRFPCRFPANTCGNCLSGFFGIPGPSNTACVDGKYNVNTVSRRVAISSTTTTSPQSSSSSSSSSSLSSHKYIRTTKERDEEEQDRNTYQYRSVSVLASPEPVPGSEGTSCVFDEDCYSGACTLMNDGTYACSENGNKPCPGSPTIQECSRKGSNTINIKYACM